MKKIIITTACAILFMVLASLTAHAATYKYDNLGRVIEVTYESGQKVTYTYDAAGNILTMTNVTPGGDAPTQPKDLVVTQKDDYSITISWTASTGKVSIAGYEVYKDGVKTDTTTATTYTFKELKPGINYSFSVKAYDAAGNYSIESTALKVRTIKYFDIDSNGAINILDIMLVAKSFNSIKGNERYVERNDLNSDGVINMADIMLIAPYFNQLVA